jgi:hypothetical protein
MTLPDRSLKITMAHAGSQLVSVDVDASSALLGSGGHCDVRVGPEYLAVEHLFLELKPAGLFGEVRSSDSPILLDGAPFHGGRIKDGSAIEIGSLLIDVAVVHREAKGPSPLARQLSPRTLVGLAALLTVGAFIVHQRFIGSDSELPRDPPTLFEGEVAVCPETTPEAAGAAAEELLQTADGRKERAPYVPDDAVQAVHLYRQVAACLRTADWEQGAEIVSRDADDLQRKTQDALHLHNVRLSRALELRRKDDAEQEIQTLRGYLGGRSGDYVDWLAKVERDLDLAGSGKAAKGG